MNRFQRRHRSGGKETLNRTSPGENEIQYDEERGKVHSNDSAARILPRRFNLAGFFRAMMVFGMCMYLLAHSNRNKTYDDVFTSMADNFSDNLPSLSLFAAAGTITNSTQIKKGSILKDEEQKPNHLGGHDDKQCTC